MIRKDNYMTDAQREAARQILRVVPLVMRTVRTEVRTFGAAQLSVPQFRAINFIERHPEASLSDVAAHVGVTLPSMSRLVDGLVDRKVMTRRGHAGDRRRLTLRVTERGRALLRAAHVFAESSIASRLAALGTAELAAVVRAMGILYPVFAELAVSGKIRNS